MRRKRKEQDHPNHERWLVSYADFMTLMFAFFVVLYASAQVDTKKMAQIAAAIAGGFQELGVFTGGSAGPPGGRPGISPQLSSVLEAQKAAGINNAKTEGLANIAGLKKELEKALGDEIKRHEVQLQEGPDGLVLSLREIGFFNSGDAALLPGGAQKLARIASVLSKRGFDIRVEGHTDNVPIKNDKYQSNWELSTARATAVIAMMVESYGLDPKSFAIAGYSEYRPVADNKSEDGRKQNRRVDLVIVSRR